MAPKPRLAPQSLKSFMEDARRTQARCDELAAALSKDGFRATVESLFEINESQRAQLDTVMTKEYDTICRDACLIALKTGGEIRYAVRSGGENKGLQVLRADVECEGDLDELHCGVTFECPI